MVNQYLNRINRVQYPEFQVQHPIKLDAKIESTIVDQIPKMSRYTINDKVFIEQRIYTKITTSQNTYIRHEN